MSETWEIEEKHTDGYHQWEISLIRTDNAHGHKSWGWFGIDKLPVATVDRWMTGGIPDNVRKHLFDAGMAAAEQLLLSPPLINQV